MGPAGTTQTVHTYAEGRRVRSQSEGPGGTRQTLWSYDAAGRRTRELTVEGDRLRARVFGYERGVLVLTEIDDDGAGHVVERRRRVYDERGKLRSRTVEQRGPAGFLTTQTHALHYDAQGRFVYELVEETPLDGERAPQVQSITIDVDDRGRVIARHVDEGMTGTFEHGERFTYGPSGSLTVSTRVRGEAIVEITRHAYDPRGRLLRTTVEDDQGRVHTRTQYDFSCWEEA